MLPRERAKHSLRLLRSRVGADTEKNLFLKNFIGSDSIFNPPKGPFSAHPSSEAPQPAWLTQPWGEAGRKLSRQPVNVPPVGRLNRTAVLAGSKWREASARISHTQGDEPFHDMVMGSQLHDLPHPRDPGIAHSGKQLPGL